MNVQYDVKIPHGTNGKYTKIFYEFYDSEHKTACVEFDTIQEAIDCAKSVLNAMNRLRIYDIQQKRVTNKVYWAKQGAFHYELKTD